MNVFVLILWLNAQNGAIEGATKVGPASTPIECQTTAAKKLDENHDEVAKAAAEGRVPFISCVDVSNYAEQLKHAAAATHL
jgi:hypothetical protein